MAMKDILDILALRRMVWPLLLQVLFAGVYVSIWLLQSGDWTWWLSALFWALLVRVIFEGAVRLSRV